MDRIALTIDEADEGYELENLHHPAFRIPVINPLHRHVFKGAKLRLNDGGWTDVARMETHGEHCLTAYRKCLAIDLEDDAALSFPGTEEPVSRRFELVSMQEDRGLSTTDLGCRIYGEHHLFPLGGRYVELIVNERPKGPYYMVTAPHEFLKESGSPFAGRGSGPVNSFKTVYYDKKAGGLAEKEYLLAHREIVSLAGKLVNQGPALYEELESRMDIDRYIEFLALNSILMNGDSADEVFFYAVPKKEGKTPYFEVMAWDLDSLFEKPHWFPQNSLIWRGRIKSTLFYSMESPLDRHLSHDHDIRLLLAREIDKLLTDDFTPAKIDEQFEATREQLLRFSSDERIMAPTGRDPGRKTPYSQSEILAILDDKRRILLDRRSFLLEQTRHILADDQSRVISRTRDADARTRIRDISPR